MFWVFLILALGFIFHLNRSTEAIEELYTGEAGIHGDDMQRINGHEVFRGCSSRT